MNALAVFLRDPVQAGLVRHIAGTDDPGLLAHDWERWCRTHLGTGLASVESVTASVGLAAGWRLDDGRKVFFKQLRAPAGESARLAAVNEVLGRLRSSGFPVPVPLAGPAPCGPGLALAQTWEDAGQFSDGHDPVHRRAQASALAGLHRLTEDWPGVEGLGTKVLPADRLWDPPHSPLFDFSRPGGVWIDAAARRARADLADRVPRYLVSHHDWSSQHLKWQWGPGEPPRLSMVYDTDSFVVIDEAHSVGLAAATFPARWDPGHDPWPSLDEVDGFLRDYQEARGPGFTDEDRAAALAYARLTAAYLDRCLHSQAALGGPGLELREYREGDIGAIASWASDPLTTRWMGPRWRAGRSLEQITQAVGRIRSGEADGVFFVVSDPADGSYLGGVDLTSVDRRTGTAVLSLVIARAERRGRGLGGEAVRLLTEYAFTVLRLRTVTLRVDPENRAAVRCYQKAGFVGMGQGTPELVEMVLRRV